MSLLSVRGFAVASATATTTTSAVVGARALGGGAGLAIVCAIAAAPSLLLLVAAGVRVWEWVTEDLPELLPRLRLRRSRDGRMVSAARGLTSFAVAVAGRRRPHLRDEWLTHLLADPSPGRAVRAACGFVCAAAKFRVGDAAAPLWRPVDWLLARASRTRTFKTLVTGAYVIYVTAADGAHNLIVANWQSPAALYAALTAWAAWLRRRRGIELASSDGGSPG